MFAGVHPHGPRLKIVLVELFAELHCVQTGQADRLVECVVVVEREIVFLLLVDGDAELLRVPHHGSVPVGDEIKQLDGMNRGLIVQDEPSRVFGFLASLAGEAVERHHVIPDAHPGCLAQVVLDDGFLDVFIHQAEHPFVGGFHSIVQGAASGSGGQLPDFRVLQRLFEANQRRPLDAHRLVHQELTHFLQQRRRIRFIGKEKVDGVVFGLERFDLSDHLSRRQAPVLIEIALAMIAERASPPVTAARCQIGKNADGNEVAVQRQSVEIGERERGRLLRVDFLVEVDSGLIAIDQVGNLFQPSLTAQRLEEPEQRVFALVHDRGVEDLGEEPLTVRQLLLKPRDHIAADRDVNLRKRLLDHLAEGQSRQELHLGADRDADHVGGLLADRGKHELPADIAVHVHLLVIQTGEHLARHPGTVPEVALHRIEHDGGRIIGGRDVMHHFPEGFQGPLQLVGIVEVFGADDALCGFGPFRQFEHVHCRCGGEARFVVCLLVGQPASRLLGVQRPDLHGHARLNPDQEGVAEKQVIHLDVHVLLDDLMPVLAQHRGETRERQIGRRRDPLRREQEHGFQLTPGRGLGRHAIDLDDLNRHVRAAGQQTFSATALRTPVPTTVGLNCNAGRRFVPNLATYRKTYSRMKIFKSQPW